MQPSAGGWRWGMIHPRHPPFFASVPQDTTPPSQAGETPGQNGHKPKKQTVQIKQNNVCPHKKIEPMIFFKSNGKRFDGHHDGPFFGQAPNTVPSRFTYVMGESLSHKSPVRGRWKGSRRRQKWLSRGGNRPRLGKVERRKGTSREIKSSLPPAHHSRLCTLSVG